MSTEMTQYTRPDLDQLDADAGQSGFGEGKSSYYKWKDGKNVVRFLPGIGGRQFMLPYQKHFVNAAPGGKAWGGACPAKMAKGRCPACVVAARLSRGTDADRAMASDISAKGRVVSVIIDRSNPDAGPQVVEFGKTVWDQLKDILKDLGEDFTNPQEGFDIVVEKTGQKLKTEYKVSAARQNNGKGAIAITPLHQDPRQAQEWLASMPNLANQVVLQSEDDIAIRLSETVVSHMLGDAPPAPRAPQGSKSGKPPIDIDDSDTPY